MKKFLSGFIAGALIFSTIAFAATYTAKTASFKVFVNGNEFKSQQETVVINGSTYMPLKAIGDVLGVPVKWNDAAKQVEVGTPPSSANLQTEGVQSNDKWKMTYLNYKTMGEINQYTKAENGKEFLIVFFEIENISSETQNFSLFNTDFYVDDTKTPQTVIGSQIDDAMQLTATQVEPGKRAKGYFAFQVAPSWRKLDIVYNEDILKQDNENVMKFTISK